MKFMVLIYNDASREPAYGTPDFDAMMGGYFAANEKMRADGCWWTASRWMASTPRGRCGSRETRFRHGWPLCRDARIFRATT